MHDYLPGLTNSECLSSGRLKPHRSILYQLMYYDMFSDLFQKGKEVMTVLYIT